MKQSLPPALTSLDIKFPEHWHYENALTAFQTLETEELYKYFNCKNRLSFSRLMQPVCPNRIDGMSHAEYIRTVLSINLEKPTTSKPFKECYKSDLPEIYPLKKPREDG